MQKRAHLLLLLLLLESLSLSDEDDDEEEEDDDELELAFAAASASIFCLWACGNEMHTYNNTKHDSQPLIHNSRAITAPETAHPRAQHTPEGACEQGEGHSPVCSRPLNPRNQSHAPR